MKIGFVRGGGALAPRLYPPPVHRGSIRRSIHCTSFHRSRHHGRSDCSHRHHAGFLGELGTRFRQRRKGGQGRGFEEKSGQVVESPSEGGATEEEETEMTGSRRPENTRPRRLVAAGAFFSRSS